MNRASLPAASLLAAILLAPGHASAAAAQALDWRFSGFATLGAVYTRSDDLRFARIGTDAPGGHNPDTGPDSILGLQLGMRLGERNTAVLQLVTRETPRNDYRPRAALAFLSHQLDPELSVRIGRLRTPFFMLSDSIDLNYGRPWVRPPVEVYGLNPFPDLDGADLLYRTRLGAGNLELHPYLGASRTPVIGGGEARLSRLRGISLMYDRGPLTLSAGHAVADLAVHRNSAEFRNFAANLPPPLRERMSGSGAHASFSSIGFQWDDGRWLFSGEIARNTAARFSNSARGVYLMAGYRDGRLTPYFGLARQHQDRTLLPAGLAATYPELGGLIDGFNRSRNQAQRSVTAGLRWDVTPDTALKAELTHVRTDRGAFGSFIPRGDAFAPGLDERSMNLLSLSVDVVF